MQSAGGEVGIFQAHHIEGHGVQKYRVHKAGGAVGSLQAHGNPLKEHEFYESTWHVELPWQKAIFSLWLEVLVGEN